jgi:hypothetical protein
MIHYRFIFKELHPHVTPFFITAHHHLGCIYICFLPYLMRNDKSMNPIDAEPTGLWPYTKLAAAEKINDRGMLPSF